MVFVCKLGDSRRHAESHGKCNDNEQKKYNFKINKTKTEH